MRTNLLFLIKQALLISVSISILIPVSLVAEYQYPSFYREPTGNLRYVEHFSKAWCTGVQNGVDGPSKQIIQGRVYSCSDRYGNYYYCDMINLQVWQQDTAGQVRVIAGTGEYGFRDGPAAQAKFFFSPVGSYDAYNNIKCDDSGRVYVADVNNNRLRMIYQKPDGRWWVSTISGNGTLTPAKGVWIKSASAKRGCAPQFGILPDGSAAYYANYGGIWKVQINHEQPESSKVTIVLTTEELTAAGLTNYVQWKSGAYMSPDSMFYWSPGDPSAYLRYNEKNGVVELYAGNYTHGVGLDNGGWRLDARFHTAELIASPSCQVLFTGGGDEQGLIRRIYQDTVKHLMADGSYLITNSGDKTSAGRPHLVDHKGRLFFTVNSSSGAETGLLYMRATFENSDTTETWEPQLSRSDRRNIAQPASASLHVFPNPFYGATLFHYQSARNGKTAALSVYNCRGEAVRSFKLLSGEGDVLWNGKDDLGRAVAGGYYFAVLKSGGTKIVKKVMNLR